MIFIKTKFQILFLFLQIIITMREQLDRSFFLYTYEGEKEKIKFKAEKVSRKKK